MGKRCALLGIHQSLPGRIKRAMELVTSPKEFPVWFSPEPISVPDKALHINILFAVEENFRWEPFEGHRTIPAYTEGSPYDLLFTTPSCLKVASVNSGTEGSRRCQCRKQRKVQCKPRGEPGKSKSVGSYLDIGFDS